MRAARARHHGAVLSASLLLASCNGGNSSDGADAHGTLTVFAAASTVDLVTSIADRYEESTGVRMRLNVAASSTLARQIERGASADVFLSANPEWMAYLDERGLLEPGTRRDLLTNTLALVVPRDRASEAPEMTSAPPGRIAIGDPEHVPVGIYARQALEALGWWEDVRGRIVPALDARGALRLAELGEVDAAIVYASDARASAGVAIIGVLPSDAHDPIRYPVAAIRGAPPEAGAFVERLDSETTPELAASYGFGRAAP